MAPLVWPRLASVILGLLVFAVRPYARDVELESYWLDRGVEVLAPMLVALGLYYLAVLPFRERPASFVARGNAFVVPDSPGQGVMVILFGLIGGGFDSRTAGLAMFCLSLLFWLPNLRLTAKGIEVRGLRTWRAAWDTLAPGHPGDPARKEQGLLVYSLRGQAWPSKYINLGQRHVNALFLARTIRHYFEHPEHRAAIGDPSELDRLKVALLKIRGSSNTP